MFYQCFVCSAAAWERARFAADDLSDGAWGIFLYPFKVVDHLPVIEPLQEFAFLQQEFRVVRSAKPRLSRRERFIKQQPIRAKRLS